MMRGRQSRENGGNGNVYFLGVLRWRGWGTIMEREREKCVCRSVRQERGTRRQRIVQVEQSA
jgi:hypothetical protein